MGMPQEQIDLNVTAAMFSPSRMHIHAPQRVWKDDRRWGSVVEHNSKVAGLVPAKGKLSLRVFFFFHIYITITTSNNMPYTFPGISLFSLVLCLTRKKERMPQIFTSFLHRLCMQRYEELQPWGIST